MQITSGQSPDGLGSAQQPRFEQAIKGCFIEDYFSFLLGSRGTY
jgi:hypothetical protein